VIGTAQSTRLGGDTVTVQFSTRPGQTVYLQVERATEASFAVGRYALAVTFDWLNEVPAANLNAVIRGPYDTLEPSDLAAALRDPAAALFHNDDDGDPAGAPEPLRFLESDRGTVPHYSTVGSLAPGERFDVYRFQSAEVPNNGSSGGSNNDSVVATLTVGAIGPNGVAPRLEVYDSYEGGEVFEHLAPFQVLANGNGTYTIQATLQEDRNYYVKVFAADQATPSGNYGLTIDFATKAPTLTTFASANMPAPAAPGAESVVKNTLYIGQAQLFQLLLKPTGGAVRMTVWNEANQVVLALNAPAGEAVSGPAVLLTPGRYRIAYTATPAPGSTVSFTVQGAVLTDPIGPARNDLTLLPLYLDEQDPTQFLYPSDPRGRTQAKFFWAAVALAW
jgi:hypothetical protein